MRVERTLGGHMAAWRHPDADGLDAILGDAPWREDGCLALVRIVRGDLDAVGRAIEARAFEARAGRPKVRRARVLGDEAPLAAVARALGFQVEGFSQAKHGLEDEVARHFENEDGRLVLLEIDRCEPDWLLRLRRLWDRLRAVQARPCIFAATDQELSVTVGRVFDLRFGYPERAPIASGSKDTLWGTFVHHVLAWESGGDPETARQLWALGGDGLERGDEEDLDALLARGAQQLWGEREAGLVRDGLHRAPDDPAPDPGVRWFWTTPEGHGPQIIPGLARRLLDREAQPCLRAMFRASLVCRPLQVWALGECLFAETLLRQALMSGLDDAVDAPIEAETLRRRRHGSPRACFFAQPSDAWDLTSLGDLAGATSLEGTGLPRELPRQLGRIRNGLAHNDPLRWGELEELIDIRSQLSAWNARRPEFALPGSRASAPVARGRRPPVSPEPTRPAMGSALCGARDDTDA